MNACGSCAVDATGWLASDSRDPFVVLVDVDDRVAGVLRDCGDDQVDQVNAALMPSARRGEASVDLERALPVGWGRLEKPSCS